ncbi:MAG: hypothetical protein KAS66_12400 [Candidatus Omnitrophica bacterium]|nr:hypothetical protein [Candidatus Omnitrophota bacterium]
MRRLMLVLFLAVMLGGMAFAQGVDIESKNEVDFWEQNVDATTEWGEWLNETVKLYLEKLSETAETYISPITEADITELSPDEIMEKVTANYVDYYKAIQDITPPLDLKVYHSKIVELFAETVKNIKGPIKNEELISKLGAEAAQEMERVLNQHGVPQKIIDEFVNYP